MKPSIHLALAAAALLLAQTASAQEALGGGRWQAADTDGDGAISSAEARAAATRQFAQLDRNHDGQIGEAEFVDARLAMFAQADSDGDGAISRAELRSKLRAARGR
jgi:Ca2+-binding EF-hand superfamily protein